MLDEVVNKLRKRGACSVVLFGSAVDTPFPEIEKAEARESG